MSVKIRMSRGGAKKRPYYSIVVVDGRKARDGRSIEQVGNYNPMLPKDHPQRVQLNAERIQYWISKGAQPSQRVAIFMHKAGIGPKVEIRNAPVKSAPKAKAQERLKAAADAAAKAAEAPAAEAATA
ncbi:MAG: 30S ribosomal protein S16 [Alphaproteobacteria bacterium]|nr:30S ribosomal protein S16 [Alphaproteobacteria bacterium]